MAIVCVLLSLLAYVSPVQDEEQNGGSNNRDATKLEMLLEGALFLTYAIPRIMGMVKVVELTDFSQALAPQLPVDPAEDEVEVAA
jgi:hypothetical protein